MGPGPAPHHFMLRRIRETTGDKSRPHQSPGRVAAPGYINEHATKVARGCGRLLAHACASLLKFLRRSLIKRPPRTRLWRVLIHKGSKSGKPDLARVWLAPRRPGPSCFYPMRPTFRTIRQAALAWAIGSAPDMNPVRRRTLASLLRKITLAWRPS